MGPVELLTQTSRSIPRKDGILPAQEIRELIRNGKIRSRAEIAEDSDTAGKH